MMNTNASQKKSEEEVCSSQFANRQTNYSTRKCRLVKSARGKVTYFIPEDMSNVFSNSLYKNFFKYLNFVEKDLPEKLPFFVELDYTTLEAFRKGVQGLRI